MFFSSVRAARNNLLTRGCYTVYAKGTQRQEDFSIPNAAKCLILLSQACLEAGCHHVTAAGSCDIL
jgi:hypothetical protein